MGITIEPLSESTLEQSLKLLLKVFDTKPEDDDYPRKWLPASLNPGSRESIKLYQSYGVIGLRYFVAMDQESGRVGGISGFYSLREDHEEAYWLAWFCVAPGYRRKGLGAMLLDHIISIARKEGKRFLRLYTSDREEERDAQAFYDSMGLMITREEKDGRYKKIFREKRI